MAHPTWQCEHGQAPDAEPPCPECCLEVEAAEPSMTEEEWRNLWDTFVETPPWTELLPESQMMFKRAWYERALPLFAMIIGAVGNYDRQLKAERN